MCCMYLELHDSHEGGWGFPLHNFPLGARTVDNIHQHLFAGWTFPLDFAGNVSPFDLLRTCFGRSQHSAVEGDNSAWLGDAPMSFHLYADCRNKDDHPAS